MSARNVEEFQLKPWSHAQGCDKYVVVTPTT